MHLVEQPPDLRVRASVDGRLRDTTVLPATTGDILVRRVLRAGGLDGDAAVPVAQSGWLHSAEPGFGPRVRVTTMPTGTGRTVVCAVVHPTVNSSSSSAVAQKPTGSANGSSGRASSSTTGSTPSSAARPS